ncbi:phosphopantetheine-binding protein, partial [Streptomyces olivaceoviridis]|uniref:phosphopantetheine-binding protein n=1 Tax=Streptomyces olivaceoviridis TaxID=1921 RepID=UPI003683B6C8
VEHLLAEIWADVLGLDRVGIHDNFFHLGGHSLLATRVVNKIDLMTGLPITLKELFLRPTVETFAGYLVQLFAAVDS